MNAPEPGSVDPAAAAIAAYLRAGYSCIPVGTDKRPSEILPDRRWAAYQKMAATPKEWMGWWLRQVRGIAIVCGAISGVYGLDADDEGFCAWLRSGVADEVLRATWTVQTACDGIHVYLRSEMPVISQVLRIGGIKLADVRGDGQGQAGPSYLVAPPTHIICPKHGKEGIYKTLYGSPENVFKVNNALAVFQGLGELYTGAQAPGTQLAVYQPPAVRHDPEIPPPLGDELKRDLERRITESTLSRKIKRALLRGCVAGVGDWVEAKDDNSFVDFALTCALLRSRFSDDDILNCFTTLHAGDFTFKNSRRGQHGLRYFYDYTLPKAKKAIEAEDAAAQIAKGDNFLITQVMKIGFEEAPLFQLTFDLGAQRTVRATLRSADFESDRSFNRAIWAQCWFMPQLQLRHQGPKGFQVFMGILAEMGTLDDDTPEEASEAGYTRSVLLSIIRSGGVQHGVSDPAANSLGWIEDGWVYIRSEILTSRIKAVMRITAPQLWAAFTRLGGEGDTLQVGKRLERIWRIRSERVGFDD